MPKKKKRFKYNFSQVYLTENSLTSSRLEFKRHSLENVVLRKRKEEVKAALLLELLVRC